MRRKTWGELRWQRILMVLVDAVSYRQFVSSFVVNIRCCRQISRCWSSTWSVSSRRPTHLCAVCPWTWPPQRPDGSWRTRQPLRSAARRSRTQSGSLTRLEERRTAAQTRIKSRPRIQRPHRRLCFYLNDVFSWHVERKTPHVHVMLQQGRLVWSGGRSRHWSWSMETKTVHEQLKKHTDHIYLTTPSPLLYIDTKNTLDFDI